MTLRTSETAEENLASTALPSGTLGTTDVPFQDVVDALDQLVVILSAEGDAEYVNVAGREYLGLATDDARNGWRAAIHPADMERVLTARTDGQATSTTWGVTVRMRRRDGVYRWFRARVTPLRDSARTLTHWTAAFTDIDDTNTLDEKLRDEQVRLAALDHVMPGVIVSFRRAGDGQITFPLVSPRYFELTGVSAEQLRADPHAGYRVVHPDDLEGVRSTLEAARRTLTPWHHAYRIVHPTRGIVCVEAHSVPRRDEDGGMTWHGVLHDVTAREAAAEQTRLWASAFRHASHGLAVGDAKTQTVLTCNDAFCALLGYAPRELDGRAVPSFFAEETSPVRRIMRELAASGRVSAETCILRKDGSLVDVQLSIVRVNDANGQPLYNVTTLQDMTARNEAARRLAESAESLRVSEERFRLIFHESPAAKTLVRLPERIIVDVNEAFLVLNRYTRSELVGKPTSILAADPTEDVSGDLARLLDTGKLDPTEHAIRRGDGTTGISEISARTFLLEGVLHSIVVHQDVTARRKAERELDESSARVKQLADSIQEVFWLTDVAKQRVIYISPAYEKIWGRSCQGLLDKPQEWLDAIHPDDRPRVRAALAKQTAGTYDEEYRVVRPDGTVRWIHDKGFPVRDDAGTVIGVAGVAQDITERHALELQLRQAQKLESIGSLAGGIAHDFNNWLTVIGGSTSLLLERTDLDADSLEILADIKLASVRAAGLTGQLLAFSRKEIVEPQIVKLNEVFADTERMLNRLLGEDIILSTSFAPNVWPVRVDRGQWSQILINLAVNARDAMPRGGQLEVATSNVTAAADAAPPLVAGAPYVLVQVTDSGIGMTPEVRTRLFEPFFTTKEAGRGTGLGLAVVHGIVTQGGGHIEVDSTPGKGSTFRLYVPALPVKTSSLAPVYEAPVAARGGTETILFVEDEEALRRFVKRALLRDGYTVLEARDGIEALEVLAAHSGPLDLVVTDVVMPRLGGRELVSRLHETRPDLRVLYTTGYTDDAVLRHGVSQAEVALVPKPFTYSALRARIRELLDQH